MLGPAQRPACGGPPGIAPERRHRTLADGRLQREIEFREAAQPIGRRDGALIQDVKADSNQVLSITLGKKCD